MAFNLDSISRGSKIRPPRGIVLGTEKIGKSEFAAGWPSPVFIPIHGEEGIDSIDVPQFPPSRSYGDVCSALSVVYNDMPDARTIVIDSVSALEPLVWLHLCQAVGDKNGNPCENIEQVMGGYAKGFTAALDCWRQITEWLDLLRTERNMSSVLIGHVKVKQFHDPLGEAYDQYQFDLHEKAANMLYRWSDLILFMNTKSVVKKEDVGFNKEHKTGLDIADGARFLYTQKRPGHPGGGRGVYGRLPYEIPLPYPNGYAAFEAAIAAAMA
jgi:hypothetical protein